MLFSYFHIFAAFIRLQSWYEAQRNYIVHSLENFHYIYIHIITYIKHSQPKFVDSFIHALTRSFIHSHITLSLSFYLFHSTKFALHIPIVCYSILRLRFIYTTLQLSSQSLSLSLSLSHTLNHLLYYCVSIGHAQCTALQALIVRALCTYQVSNLL